MGLQSCKLAPAVVRTCEHSCTDNCVNDCGDRDTEAYGMVGVQAISAMLDRYPGSDPVGAIFEETLEQLGPLERELMMFSATSNVLAVRWLLHLGARWDVGDTNNSTCLHVACRAGSIPIVMELLSFPSLLQAVDVARWSPLHIAAFMGRREVVVRLLNAHADPTVLNFARQTPLDLCFDAGTLEAFRESTEAHAEIIAGSDLADKSRQWEDNAGAPIECEHIPFFLPPVAAFHARDRHEELWSMAVLIFNLQPSYGLGFAVATGLSCSYAEALLRLLHRPNANRGQVGGFLGEALSLSFLTRLSLFDSVDLQNTGVISALRNVFRIFQIPEDLQKTNRLLLGLAQVWWRKHRREDALDDELMDAAIDATVGKEKAGLPLDSIACDAMGARSTYSYESHPIEEMTGSYLKACLSSMESLAHLMFSTVLLHRYIHNDGTVKRKEFSLTTWMSLNKGLGSFGDDLPVVAQRQIHQIVSQEFIKELVMAAPKPDVSPRGEVCWERNTINQLSRMDGGGPDEGAGLPRAVSRMSCLSPCATIEGWAQQRFVGARTQHRDLSEVPASVVASGMSPRHGAANEDFLESLYLHSLGSKMWLSLCGSILFLWTNAQRGTSNVTPHMFIDIVQSRVVRLQAPPASSREGETGRRNSATSKTIALVGAPEPPQTTYNVFGGDRKVASVPNICDHTVGSTEGEQEMPNFGGADVELPLTVVHLLPDGRWQEIHLVRLELQFLTEKESEEWTTRLSEAQACAISASSTMHPSKKHREDSSKANSSGMSSIWLGDTPGAEDHSEAFAGDMSGRFVRASAACQAIHRGNSLNV